uniref:Uncharacterized protein n=1 Tax=Physcomitrium patens TaxID=3218 RepID=A0A2K1KHF1_PHYPA|nr:hypothetical protein PHYPA_009586 [Physcomitrium patens]
MGSTGDLLPVFGLTTQQRSHKFNSDIRGKGLWCASKTRSAEVIVERLSRCQLGQSTCGAEPSKGAARLEHLDHPKTHSEQRTP